MPDRSSAGRVRVPACIVAGQSDKDSGWSRGVANSPAAVASRPPWFEVVHASFGTFGPPAWAGALDGNSGEQLGPPTRCGSPAHPPSAQRVSGPLSWPLRPYPTHIAASSARTGQGRQGSLRRPPRAAGCPGSLRALGDDVDLLSPCRWGGPVSASATIVELEATRRGQLRPAVPGLPRRLYATGRQEPCSPCAAAGVDRQGVSRYGPGSPALCMSCWRAEQQRRSRAEAQQAARGYPALACRVRGPLRRHLARLRQVCR